MDVGSDGYPFPYATVLVDKFLEPTMHRSEEIVMDSRPLIVADLHALPFKDKVFDFIYCSHALEHVDHPIQACRELMRVGNRGYIETPTLGKEVLFAWAKGMHKWHVVTIGRTLCFFEYSQRQLEGIKSSAWRDLIFSKWSHPLQQVFWENQDIFNVMFTWENDFSVLVFKLDGTIEGLNIQVACRNEIPYHKHRLP